MKKQITLSLMIVLSTISLGCSTGEQIEWADDYPMLAPATQATENVQQRIDPLAQKGEALAHAIRDASRGAEAIGIPGAGLVALIAGVFGTVLGVYNERRRGTIPMRSALEQIVQSVEAAFPEKSDMHKSMMAAKQDRATQRLVSEIKGS